MFPDWGLPFNIYHLLLLVSLRHTISIFQIHVWKDTWVTLQHKLPKPKFNHSIPFMKAGFILTRFTSSSCVSHVFGQSWTAISIQGFDEVPLRRMSQKISDPQTWKSYTAQSCCCWPPRWSQPADPLQILERCWSTQTFLPKEISSRETWGGWAKVSASDHNREFGCHNSFLLLCLLMRSSCLFISLP